jgi:Na+-transporting NADH:ubiquinone oxidoreductase subunit C
MKDSRLYTVVYSLLLCAACAALLTFASTFWDKEIKANEQFSHTRAVVDAMGLCQADTPRRQVMDIYTSSFEAKKKGEMDIIEARKDGQLVGYAFDLVTQGKYGIIRGVLAVSAAKDKILGFRIYQQCETPGLGGRISEPAWLAQFAGKPLVTDGAPGIIISNSVKGPNVVDAITGATKTTFTLGRALNAQIAGFLSGGMALQALDLDLSADAVTRATPGYPKNLQKPPHLREETRRADFMVPAGVTNVALSRTVTSSMTEDPIIGSLKQLTDGIKRSGEFDFVELDPDPQWVQVDLGQSHTLSCVVVWHYYKNPVIYNDVIVQLADDALFTTNVRTVFNNDHDNSSAQGLGTDTAYFARWWGEIVDTRGAGKEGTAARFIRVWSNGACGGEPTRFVEVQAYGK